MYFGANITGGEGGATNTMIVCDDYQNNYNYTLEEVDKKGAVVKDHEHRYQRLILQDYGSDGVRILRDVNDNPRLKPGEKLNVKVGTKEVTIGGTSTKGVLINGETPNPLTKELEDVRYPR